MSKILEAKKKQVEEIKERISRCQSVILVDYKGLTVKDVTQLRNDFRAKGIEYRVLKNTLVKRAFNELGVHDLDAHLEGPTAVAFGYDDPVAAAKLIVENSKKIKLTPKCGIADGAFVDAKGIEALAALPSKEALVAMALQVMNSPITGMATVCANVIKSVCYALNAIKDKQA